MNIPLMKIYLETMLKQLHELNGKKHIKRLYIEDIRHTQAYYLEWLHKKNEVN